MEQKTDAIPLRGGSSGRRILFLLLPFLFLPFNDACAVIPAVVGPLQALIAILPQLTALLLAGLVALFKPQTYRALLKFLWTQKILVLSMVVVVAGVVWGWGKLFGGSVGQEVSGTSWVAMRGGPDRAGAVPGAKGPMAAAKIQWTYAGKKSERIDSCPAVVGNRIYSSSAVLSLFSSGGASGSGALYCRDTQGGGVVWKYTGEGMDGPSLTSIFSSPAIGGEFSDSKGKDGKPEEGRYLVSGEGYHTDFNSRFFCLDLEPVKKGGSAPALKWFKQATGHVESSPCIHKGGDGAYRAYVGAGDDGIWCVELESGKLAWMVEGTKAYYVHADCKRADEVKALVGKKVELKCKIERLGATVTHPGQVLIKEISGLREIGEIPPVVTDAGNKDFERTIAGTVERGDIPEVEGQQPGSRKKLKEATGIYVAIPRYYLDVESAPVAADFPKDRSHPDGQKKTLLFFGTGLGGESGVACLDGISGMPEWFYPVRNPVFSAPTVIKGVKVKAKNSKGEATEKETDVLIVGYGEGDFVNVAANPEGAILCLDIRDVKDGKPAKLWEVKTGDTILGAVAAAAKDGLAFACARDGRLYVVNIKDGSLAKNLHLGSSLVCSPVVTEDAIYAVSLNGMAYCVDRGTYATRWSLSVTACADMYGSPVVAGGRMFIGTPGQGLMCLVEDVGGARKTIKPWTGAGGDAARGGAADNGGLPSVDGDTVRHKWKSFENRTVDGPLAACGGALYLMVKGEGEQAEKLSLVRVNSQSGEAVWSQELNGPLTALAATEQRVYGLRGKDDSTQELFCLHATNGAPQWVSPAVYVRDVFSLDGNRLVVAGKKDLVCLDAATGGELWKREMSGISGAPATVHGLVLVAVGAVGGESPRLFCLDDEGGRDLWSASLPGKPAGAVTCAGEQVFVGCEEIRETNTVGSLVAHALTDGKQAWKRELSGAPVGYPAGCQEYVAMATADGRLFAFDSAGKSMREEGYMVSRSQSPALVHGVAVYAGLKSLGAWNLSSGSWPWKFYSRQVMGRTLAPPVIMGEVIYVVTEQRELMAVGPTEKPKKKEKTS